MNWFYAEGGQQRGPVTQEEFDRLVASGVINDTTLVWREGMGTWQPWGAQKPVRTPPLASSAVAAPPLQTSLGTACEVVLARDYPVSIGSCFDRAHQLVMANFGLLLGSLVLSWFILVAGGMVPLLGMFASFFLTGPLMGGLFLVYLARLRGRPATVGMIFDGFSARYWDLVLSYLIPVLLSVAVVAAAALVVVPVGIFVVRADTSTQSPVLFGVLVALAVLVGLAVWIAMMYFYICWIFSIWLTADKKLPFWSAMELSRKVVRKHWWRIFFVYFLSTLVTMAGTLLCLVGLLYAGPLVVAVWAYLYEDIFGDLAPHSP